MPLRIPLEHSRVLIAALVTLHLAALGALLTYPFPRALMFALVAAILVSLAHQWFTRVLRRGDCGVIELRRGAGGEWSLCLGDGRDHRAELLRAQVFRWLVILAFRTRLGRCTVLVAADSVDRDTHRRLRIAVLEARHRRRDAQAR
ncbi:MAG: protein YgfX [Thiotrichales bacterium]